MVTRHEPITEAQPTHPTTLVWIDARKATIVRLEDDEPHFERFDSDVPPHHRTTGHVRHEPSVRHGGGGPQQTAGEPRRLEHLARFVDRIEARLPAQDDLVILGSGTVRERLARQVRETDEHQRRQRRISCEASARLTDRQLVARLHAVSGTEARRRTVGAYRWTEPPMHLASGKPRPVPRRVAERPKPEPDPIED